MVNIYNEDFFLNHFEDGDSFQPVNFTFIIIYGGKVEVEHNKYNSTYYAQQVLFLSPFNIYKFNWISNDLKAYVLSMDRAVMRRKINFNFNRYEVYRLTNIDQGGILIPFSQIEVDHILALSQQIIFYKSKPIETFKDDIINCLFSAIVYNVVEKILDSKNKYSVSNSRKEEITIEFIALVYQQFKEHKDLSFYADRLRISIKYLSNCLRIITKFPPTQIIYDALVNEAKILLLNKENTISSISIQLGFSDQYSFGKFFKKQTGLSPSNFRKQNNTVHFV